MTRGLLILIIGLFSFSLTSLAIEKADQVVVYKSKSLLVLKRKNKVLKEFKIALGTHPKGHKEKVGDKKTPEGHYLLDFKNSQSQFYKSIHISYPNSVDQKKAAAQGWSPGGDIMIHGQKNGYEWLEAIAQWFNWTDGCIALKNKEMDEVWQAVDVGTPIEIFP